VPARSDRPLLYAVTRQWLDVVAAEASLFLPAEAVWSRDAVQALIARVVDSPDYGGDGFQEKLRHQAQEEGPAGQRVAAEAMFVFLLKDASGLESTKRTLVQRLLEGLDPVVTIPAELDQVFAFGLARYGAGRARSLWDYLFVLRFAARWAGLDDTERASLLQDGWAFRELLRSLPQEKATFARDALQHLVHPDTFEAIASLTHKRKILRSLGNMTVTKGTDLDRELAKLRQQMEASGTTPDFSFYDPTIRPQWDPVQTETVEDDQGTAEDDDGGTLPNDGSISKEAAPKMDLIDLTIAAEDAGLALAPRVLAGLLAALNSGKHVILTGAPGTAKTTLAEVVARVAASAGRCAGHVLATATADWSTYETVGGLRPLPDGTLEFAPGVVLEAIDANRWLVLDEMNRANTDRALGPLFTVLSGQAVVVSAEQDGLPVRIRPSSVKADAAYRDYVVQPGWRIIATTNVLDRALLFDLSFALMRRFAFVDVGAPDDDGYRALIRDAVAEDPVAERDRTEMLVGRLLPLIALRPLGPALFMDAARYVGAYIAERPLAPDGEVVADAFLAFLLPQFEGVDERQSRLLLQAVVKAAGADQGPSLRATLRQTLGVALPEQKGAASHDAANADPDIGDDDGGTDELS
jgi:hypothetical protein